MTIDREPVTIPNGLNLKGPDDTTIDGIKFVFYREHFDFGTFPAYQSNDRRFRFWYAKTGEMLTGAELADYLTGNWVQQSERGICARCGLKKKEHVAGH